MNRNNLRRVLYILTAAGCLSAVSLLPMVITDGASLHFLIFLIVTIVLFLFPAFLQGPIAGDHRLHIHSQWLFYGWAILSVGCLTWLVIQTGGIKNSPLVWIYELAIILSLILTQFAENTSSRSHWMSIARRFRCSIMVLLFCMVAVIVLSIVGQSAQHIQPPVWYYYFMLSYTMFLSVFIFFLSKEHWIEPSESEEHRVEVSESEE